MYGPEGPSESFLDGSRTSHVTIAAHTEFLIVSISLPVEPLQKSPGYARARSSIVMAAKKRPAQQIAKRYPPYLLARQIAALNKLSDDTETPVQHHIRQAIDEYLARLKKTKRSRSATAS